MLDTPAADAVACLLAGSTMATTPDLSNTGWTLLRADAVWASNNRDRSAARTPGAPTLPRTGLATPATVSCRWYAAVQLAPWRTALVCWIWMVRVEGNGTKESWVCGVMVVGVMLMGGAVGWLWEQVCR